MNNTPEHSNLCIHVSIAEKTIKLCSNRTNENGELQIALDMSDGTSLCITHVTHNLRPYNSYFTVKHRANADDIAANKYRATNHEKCSFVYPTLEQLETGLSRYLNKILTETNTSINIEQKGIQCV